jgi:acetyl esterase/lipase
VPDDFTTARVVHRVSGMDRVQVRKDLPYRADPELLFDLYLPPDGRGPTPAVVFVHGDGPPEVLRSAKDWGQYASWGELTSASGLAAVTFNHRSSERGSALDLASSDVDALIAHLRNKADRLQIDPQRIAIWVCSMGPPVGLRSALRDRPSYLRAIVTFYGLMDLTPLRGELHPGLPDEVVLDHSPIHHLRTGSGALPPMLMARAGREERPWLNPTIDAFAAEAVARNMEIDLLNHPAGHHAFDVLDDDRRSRDIIQRTLDFLRLHLDPETQTVRG